MAFLQKFPTLMFGFGFALLLWLALQGRPRALLVVWLSAICFVPWWTGVNVSVFVPAASLVSMFALLCFVPFVASRFFLTDLAVACLFAACLIPALVGTGTKTSVFGILAVALPAFLVGRSIVIRVGVDWIYACVTVIFAVVSVLAIAEFLLSWNPFSNFRFSAGSSYATWSPLLKRGGRTRVEGAFGHPIALGACLALAIPMTLASRLRFGHRMMAVAVMLIACVLTFSRTGMLSAALGLGLGIVFLRDSLSPRARAGAIGAVVVLSATLVPLVTGTFAAAGTEASGSAAYRGQLTSLISQMDLVGLSRSAQVLSDGQLYFGRFRSIDSQLILFGLTYGSLALAVGLLLLVVGSVLVVTGKATAPTIAVVAQIPSLATVALITQYSVFFWFVAGLAAATQTQAFVRSDHVGSYESREVRVRNGANPTVLVGGHYGRRRPRTTIRIEG